MNKVFLITGGAGRVIAAIPALEKFHRLNPDNDFKVLMAGWEDLYLSHPLLQDRTFPIGHKNFFQDYVKDNILIEPEPYHLHSFYNQKTSLAEAFDEIINETDDHSDLQKPNLYLSSFEQANANKFLVEFMSSSPIQREKIVVIQPYGSTMTSLKPEVKPEDSSGRSLDPESYIELIKNLDEKILLIYFGPENLRHPQDNITSYLRNSTLRDYMSLIAACDYFIGCDSVGQHMARAFNKPGTVFMGSTFEKNVSYPEHFDFFRDPNRTPSYIPMRISNTDSMLADRRNSGIMTFSTEQMAEAGKALSKKILGLGKN